MPTLLATRPEIVDDVTRRDFLVALGGSALLVGLGACGGDEEDTSSAAGEPADSPGSTVAKPRPTRVVALGQGADADTLIALGIVPVAMSKGFGADIYRWTQAALGGQSPTLIETIDTVPIEQIAALKPDLIVATTFYGFADNAEALGKIATTLGPQTTADKETWKQTALRVGEAVGMADEARRLVDKAEGTVAAARDRHPDWRGKTFTFGPVDDLAALYTVNARDDASAALIEQLGLTLSPAVTALPSTETAGRASVSLERLDLLEADALVLVYFADEARSTLEANPLFRRIPAVGRGSYVDLDRSVAIGAAFPSVLSIPFVVERLEPELARAIAAR